MPPGPLVVIPPFGGRTFVTLTNPHTRPANSIDPSCISVQTILSAEHRPQCKQIHWINFLSLHLWSSA